RSRRRESFHFGRRASTWRPFSLFRDGHAGEHVRIRRQLGIAGGEAVDLEDVGGEVGIGLIGQAARLAWGHAVVGVGVELANGAAGPVVFEVRAGERRAVVGADQVGAVAGDAVGVVGGLAAGGLFGGEHGRIAGGRRRLGRGG